MKIYNITIPIIKKCLNTSTVSLKMFIFLLKKKKKMMIIN